ncbi:polysaccharide pyruvyl transferase family protein [Thalassotalea litorea]|uniref:Polysaccharide pyruvyl transferase family protein n=1 Tax=Thalassotalea litorea TaxID=2020715 RepID=A0A5R9IHT8_9GAMM|nr:polysaccharide pyruvyl transferase family protein [Thalassotalea litorea]TLU65094.1 polysaccharide pyruvyl transferase family protein [Thalassotalea litorea]
MKIGIVGVGKSPNIGDQLIAKTLGKSIESLNHDHQLEYFDLDEGQYDVDFSHPVSNRSYTPSKEVQNKSYYLRFFKLLAFDAKNAKTYEQQIENFIRDKDLLIIGGGHLLIDNFGSFILKISRVTKLAQRFDIKFAFWGVGVGDELHYSWKSLAGRYIPKSTRIFTRDSKSKIKIQNQGYYNVNTIIDPGFFSDLLDLKQTDIQAPQKSLTIFMMDPYETHRHSSVKYSREEIALWWSEFFELATSHYNDIKIANNGGLADWYFIDKYLKPNLPDNVTILPRALSYKDLVVSVNDADTVIAQRLHAVIPSIALKKKFYAFKWDTKLENILTDLGLEDSLIDFTMKPSSLFEIVKDNDNPTPTYQMLDEKKQQYLDALKNLLGSKL